MLVDFNSLYSRAFDTKLPGEESGLGTWKGHRDIYESYRIGLKRMIKNAEANGCAVPGDAYEWAEMPAPDVPNPKTPLR
jgi:hypothetical protein